MHGSRLMTFAASAAVCLMLTGCDWSLTVKKTQGQPATAEGKIMENFLHPQRWSAVVSLRPARPSAPTISTSTRRVRTSHLILRELQGSCCWTAPAT